MNNRIYKKELSELLNVSIHYVLEYLTKQNILYSIDNSNKAFVKRDYFNYKQNDIK